MGTNKWALKVPMLPSVGIGVLTFAENSTVTL
jgi:hypothetical protein